MEIAAKRGDLNAEDVKRKLRLLCMEFRRTFSRLQRSCDAFTPILIIYGITFGPAMAMNVIDMLTGKGNRGNNSQSNFMAVQLAVLLLSIAVVQTILFSASAVTRRCQMVQQLLNGAELEGLDSDPPQQRSRPNVDFAVGGSDTLGQSISLLRTWQFGYYSEWCGGLGWNVGGLLISSSLAVSICVTLSSVFISMLRTSVSA